MAALHRPYYLGQNTDYRPGAPMPSHVSCLMVQQTDQRDNYLIDTPIYNVWLWDRIRLCMEVHRTNGKFPVPAVDATPEDRERAGAFHAAERFVFRVREAAAEAWFLWPLGVQPGPNMECPPTFVTSMKSTPLLAPKLPPPTAPKRPVPVKPWYDWNAGYPTGTAVRFHDGTTSRNWRFAVLPGQYLTTCPPYLHNGTPVVNLVYDSTAPDAEPGRHWSIQEHVATESLRVVPNWARALDTLPRFRELDSMLYELCVSAAINKFEEFHWHLIAELIAVDRAHVGNWIAELLLSSYWNPDGKGGCAAPRADHFAESLLTIARELGGIGMVQIPSEAHMYNNCQFHEIASPPWN